MTSGKERMIVTLTEGELGQLIDNRVRAAMRDELDARAPASRPSTCSVAEAARELNTTTRTIKRWISAGRLHASRVVPGAGSSRVRITRASVDRLLTELSKAS
jgi:excisionase family DNA binding protein